MDRVASTLGPNVQFNAYLVRLYFDGDDTIAWHTGRKSFFVYLPLIITAFA